MNIATLVLMKVKQKTKLWDEFQVMLRRYDYLKRGKAPPLDDNPAHE